MPPVLSCALGSGPISWPWGAHGAASQCRLVGWGCRFVHGSSEFQVPAMTPCPPEALGQDSSGTVPTGRGGLSLLVRVGVQGRGMGEV